MLLLKFNCKLASVQEWSWLLLLKHRNTSTGKVKKQRRMTMWVVEWPSRGNGADILLDIPTEESHYVVLLWISLQGTVSAWPSIKSDLITYEWRPHPPYTYYRDPIQAIINEERTFTGASDRIYESQYFMWRILCSGNQHIRSNNIRSEGRNVCVLIRKSDYANRNNWIGNEGVSVLEGNWRR